jgi:hypothetical protein
LITAAPHSTHVDSSRAELSAALREFVGSRLQQRPDRRASAVSRPVHGAGMCPSIALRIAHSYDPVQTSETSGPRFNLSIGAVIKAAAY